jgi:hypothetical protein
MPRLTLAALECRACVIQLLVQTGELVVELRGAGQRQEAAGSERAMVRPPPGVSSGRRVPPIGSARLRDTASPSPTPAVWLGWPSPPRRAELAQRAHDDLAEVGGPGEHGQRPGLQPAHVQQAGR